VGDRKERGDGTGLARGIAVDHFIGTGILDLISKKGSKWKWTAKKIHIGIFIDGLTVRGKTQRAIAIHGNFERFGRMLPRRGGDPWPRKYGHKPDSDIPEMSSLSMKYYYRPTDAIGSGKIAEDAAKKIDALDRLLKHDHPDHERGLPFVKHKLLISVFGYSRGALIASDFARRVGRPDRELNFIGLIDPVSGFGDAGDIVLGSVRAIREALGKATLRYSSVHRGIPRKLLVLNDNREGILDDILYSTSDIRGFDPKEVWQALGESHTNVGHQPFVRNWLWGVFSNRLGVDDQLWKNTYLPWLMAWFLVKFTDPDDAAVALATWLSGTYGKPIARQALADLGFSELAAGLSD